MPFRRRTAKRRRTITQEIRSQLRAAGKLGAEDHEFTRLVAVNASEPERGQATTFRPGDVLQFHQNAPGFTKGERLSVTDPAAVPLEHAARSSRFTGRRRSPWPKATASASPAR